MFCDHGADMNIVTKAGLTPLLYAATNGFDGMCMYLSLRTDNVDQEDMNTGENVFNIYLKKRDINRMQ